MVNITSVNLLQLATSYQYLSQIQTIANTSTNHVSFVSYDDSFMNITGDSPTQELVTTEPYAAFHEAGSDTQCFRYLMTGKLYFTSNWNGSLSNPINVTAISVHNVITVTSLRYSNLQNANGGAAYYPPGTPAQSSKRQQIVFCDQGDLNHPSQLVKVDPATNKSRVLIDNFLGRNFTSVNDVEQHPVTGDLWFTDARYAYWQGFRPALDLPPQVYRFSPKTGVVQAVADGFIAPNGIEISPDWKYIYVTDTGSITYPNALNLTDTDLPNTPRPSIGTNADKSHAPGPATIYRYDVSGDGKRLTNRQVFAYADTGIPAGIHTDTNGNVYTGVGDGINVYNPSGVLIAKFAIANEGVNNFAFVPCEQNPAEPSTKAKYDANRLTGGMYIGNNYHLFKIGIQAEGRTVRRDFEVAWRRRQPGLTIARNDENHESGPRSTSIWMLDDRSSRYR